MTNKIKSKAEILERSFGFFSLLERSCKAELSCLHFSTEKFLKQWSKLTREKNEGWKSHGQEVTGNSSHQQ